MAGFDFEREIKKDVQNNPIVREVDSARQRELWRSVGIGVFLVIVLLFSAWQHFELLQNGYRIEQMQQDRARELEVNRHLRLEIATLKAPRRIEQIARDQLGMVTPPVSETIVIERVSPIGADPGIMARRGETQRKATGELVADVSQHP
jgi:cell division protein FtsL